MVSKLNAVVGVAGVLPVVRTALTDGAVHIWECVDIVEYISCVLNSRLQWIDKTNKWTSLSTLFTKSHLQFKDNKWYRGLYTYC